MKRVYAVFAIAALALIVSVSAVRVTGKVPHVEKRITVTGDVTATATEPEGSGGGSDTYVFKKNVVVEETLKVQGMNGNGDTILEVEKDSDLKGDVRVGGNLGVENDTTLGGNLLLEGTPATISAVGDFIFSANLGAAKRSPTVVEYAVYTAITGLFSFNGGAIRYSPATGINANDGSMTIVSKNSGTELDIKSVGETTLERKTGSKCALLLKEHPDNTDTTHDLMVVSGRSSFNNQIRVSGPPARKRSHEPLLVVEGDIEVSGSVNSPGNIKDREAASNADVIQGNFTRGERFAVTALCSASKVVTGGGCSISGANTDGLLERRSEPASSAYICEYMQIYDDTSDTDATITAYVFCVTSVA